MEDHKIPNSETELGRFFDRERGKKIILMMSRYSLSKEEAEDTYQDACLALFKNIKEKKLVKLTVPLTTYFTKICFNLSLKKKRGPLIEPFDFPYDSERLDELSSMIDEDTSEQWKKLIRKIVKDLPKPCETILWSFYESNLSLSEIAKELDYKNADTAKSKKSQCMSKLKQRVNEEALKYGRP